MRKTLLLSLLAPLLVTQGVPPEEPSRIVAVGERYAVVMAPPEVVASAYVENFAWSGDGSALLVKRIVVPDDVPAKSLLVARQVDGEGGVASLSRRTELVAWNVRARKARLLLAYDPQTFVLGELTRVPNDDRFYGFLRENLIDPTTRLGYVRISHLILDTGSGTLVRVPVADPSRSSQLEFGRKGAVVLVQTTPDGRRSVALVGVNGALGRPAVLPARAYFAFDEVGIPQVALMKTDANGRRRAEWHRFDLASGIVGAVVAPPPTPPERATTLTPSSAPAAVAGAETTRLPGDGGRVRAWERGATGWFRLVLAPGEAANSAIVTSDGATARLSPKEDAVAYLSEGNAMVRTFARLSLAEYVQAERDTERERTIARGRQMGAALANYASDADDALPPLSFDFREAVYPYVKSRSVFEGFTPTYGGELPKEGLSGFQIGYVSGPGGRVLIFGDGSIRWKPDVP